MTKLEKMTITLNTIFNFGAVLVSSFISVYLYIYTNSIPLMCLYIIVRIGLFPVFFMLGNIVSKKHTFAVTYVLGITLITIALVIALFGGSLFESNPFYVLIVAAVIGSGEGFYYFSANNMNQIASPNNEYRKVFFSYNGIFGNMTSLLAPIFATIVLANSPSEIKGYETILMVIIIIFIIVIVIAFKMNKRSADTCKGFGKAFSFKDKEWNRHSVAVFFFGLRNALELNTVSLLLYNASASGNVYSRLQIVFSLVTILSYRVIVQYLSKDKIERTFKLGVLLKIVCITVLVFVPNIYGAIAYGLINALAVVLYDNTYNVISANIIYNYKEDTTARVVARETFLSLGRCVGMAFVILCFKLLPSGIYLQVAVMVLALAPIVTEKLFIKAELKK